LNSKTDFEIAVSQTGMTDISKRAETIRKKGGNKDKFLSREQKVLYLNLTKKKESAIKNQRVNSSTQITKY
jgi:hypothetical protein